MMRSTSLEVALASVLQVCRADSSLRPLCRPGSVAVVGASHDLSRIGLHILVVGPDCLGLLNTDPDVRFTASFSPLFPPLGPRGEALHRGDSYGELNTPIRPVAGDNRGSRPMTIGSRKTCLLSHTRKLIPTREPDRAPSSLPTSASMPTLPCCTGGRFGPLRW